MGWTQQGYNAQGFNPSLGITSNYWHVECNGDGIDEVEHYSELKVALNGWEEKLKIVYGMSRKTYFRGYVLTNDIKMAKVVLNTFHEFLVYEGKYGGVKAFNANCVTLIPFLNSILFIETNATQFLSNKPIPLPEIEKEIFDEFVFGITHGFIDDFGKSQDKIFQELKYKIQLKGKATNGYD